MQRKDMYRGYRHWLGALLVAMFFFVSAPVPVFAQTATGAAESAAPSCTCFCTAETGTKPGKKMTKRECATSCQQKGEHMVTCAFSAAQFPDRANLNCFSKTECEGETYNGIFDKAQPRDCPAGKHLCFPKPEPIKLFFHLGDTTQVVNLGQYIQIGYNYALSLSLIIVVVFLMIGGIQYILAAGVPSQLESAKKRIRGALIGMAILIGAALILQTVNPALIHLNPPKANLIKRIVLLTGEESCEDIVRRAKEANPALKTEEIVNVKDTTKGPYGKQMCGSVAPLLLGPSGTQVPDGTTCQYRGCKDSTTQCAGNGDEAKCLSCQDVVPPQDLGLTTGVGIKATSEICRQLQKPNKTAGGKTVQANYCFWTTDADLTVNGFTTANSLALFVAPNPFAAVSSIEAVSAIKNGTCAEISINCSNITSCRDYDDVLAKNDIENACLDDISPLAGGDLELGNICNSSDPCGVAPPGETCEVIEWLGRTDCVNSGAKEIFDRIDVPTDYPAQLVSADAKALESFFTGEITVSNALKFFTLNVIDRLRANTDALADSVTAARDFVAFRAAWKDKTGSFLIIDPGDDCALQ